MLKTQAMMLKISFAIKGINCI